MLTVPKNGLSAPSFGTFLLLPLILTLPSDYGIVEREGTADFGRISLSKSASIKVQEQHYEFHRDPKNQYRRPRRRRCRQCCQRSAGSRRRRMRRHLPRRRARRTAGSLRCFRSLRYRKRCHHTRLSAESQVCDPRRGAHLARWQIRRTGTTEKRLSTSAGARRSQRLPFHRLSADFRRHLRLPRSTSVAGGAHRLR